MSYTHKDANIELVKKGLPKGGYEFDRFGDLYVDTHQGRGGMYSPEKLKILSDISNKIKNGC